MNAYIGRPGTAQILPQIAMHKSGLHVIIWQDYRNDKYKSQIFFQIFKSEGQSIGKNVLHQDTRKCRTLFDPSLAMDNEGNFIMVWEGYPFEYYQNGSVRAHIYAQRYNQDALPIGSNIRVDDEVSWVGQQIGNPHIAITKEGCFVVVWDDWRVPENGLYGQHFAKDGTPVGGNFKISEQTTAVVFVYPKIEISEDGNFIVTWTSIQNDVYIQIYSSDGSPIGKNIKVNEHPIIGENLTHADLGSNIAVDDSGKIIIVWDGVINGVRDIYGQFFTQKGNRIGNNFNISTGKHQYNMLADVTLENSGNYKVSWLWLGEHHDKGIALKVISSEGETIKTIENLTVANFNSDSPGIAADSLGNFTITWADRRNQHDFDIFAQRFTSAGEPIGSNYKINDDTGGIEHSHPDIAVDKKGNFSIAWLEYWGEQGDETLVKAQRFSPAGEPLGINFLADPYYGEPRQNSPVIGYDFNNDFMIAWQYEYEGGFNVLTMPFYGDGNMIYNDGPMNVSRYYYQGTAYHPAMALDNQGHTVVAWECVRDDQSYILVQRLRDHYRWLGPEIYVNDSINKNLREAPAVAIDSSGNFVVVWQELRQGAYDIFAQKFFANGEKFDTNFQLNSESSTVNHKFPVVVLDENRIFTLVWQDDRNGNRDIFARQFSFDGNPLTGEYRVNDDLGWAEQTQPTIDCDHDGSLVIAWTDFRNGDADIYAQRFLSDGTPYKHNFLIPNETEGTQENPEVKLFNKKIYTTWANSHYEITGNNIRANILNWSEIDTQANHIPGKIPGQFELCQNYPNPFNAATQISFQINETTPVTLKIFDVRGREVETLVNRTLSAGLHRVHYQAPGLPSGIYLFRLIVNGRIATRKCVLLK
ncbi:MAG: T9SS type A sorting domain-containing protein [Methanosarcinaceae archaeon]